MCTLIVAKDFFSGHPIVVAANRDELLDRPSAPPTIQGGGAGRFLAPTDLLRGGTWIGVNAAGVFAGITNRMEVVSVAGRVTRGELVKLALVETSARDAFERLRRLSGRFLNGFNLVIADRREMFLLRGDGNEIRAEDCGEFAVVTNHGVWPSTDVELPPRVRAVLDAWKAAFFKGADPGVESLRRLLDIHGDSRHGTCINEPAENYGTKSSSIVRLDAADGVWRYWHRERPDAESHVCTASFGEPLVLPLAP